MGTINYRTSDYITLGIKPYDTDDLMKDDDFLDYVKTEYGYTMNDDEDTIYDIACETIQEYTEADYTNAEMILDKYSFYYYTVSLENGYYEGFSLDIKNNFPCVFDIANDFPAVFDDYTEKMEAQKEITQIKEMLIELSGCGMVAVYPGWCTGYEDYKGTQKAIAEAIKEMRQEVKNIPTYRVYERKTA